MRIQSTVLGLFTVCITPLLCLLQSGTDRLYGGCLTLVCLSQSRQMKWLKCLKYNFLTLVYLIVRHCWSEYQCGCDCLITSPQEDMWFEESISANSAGYSGWGIFKTLKYAIITLILAIDILHRTLGDEGGAAEISRESRARAHWRSLS